MQCLHCGNCCKHMSPISNPNPCPHLTQDGDYYFCSEYVNRPQECADQDFDSRFCPIGMRVLGFDTAIEVAHRIDHAHANALFVREY